MKTVVVFGLLLTLILPGLFKLGTFISWDMNRAEITARYCINKFKTEKKCNGKCRLSVLLKLYDQENIPLTDKGSGKWSESDLSPFETIESVHFDEMVFWNAYGLVRNFGYIEEHRSNHYVDIFHPPSILKV
ncbi:MAG: hypothetical protein KA251_01745 [Saprospiraceae bacterium]|nr:hypothetical protein [Candidatus Vicinibacter affinis]MBP6172815.1 hypothetical protein [Saprospiraceae bacterium]MBK6572682.1 hypothetical protein [Candidatus Vicinibacter affinis]MBK6824460.1 hypothetical protein [Candidatus Vicinibacter affinis]MBK7303463.1 hypothetical protein [Candidatus Vicinibacter affinis]